MGCSTTLELEQEVAWVRRASFQDRRERRGKRGTARSRRPGRIAMGQTSAFTSIEKAQSEAPT